jgi:anaerobic magnesium-protoporphyrin IX monomethyl ester cyclase
VKILLINTPYQTITSNFGVGHQVPLGLLMVGGPLVDAGHDVRLIDAECGRLSIASTVAKAGEFQPDVIMTGHAGSTPAHPICLKMLRAIRQAWPKIITIYGGVYPTYHAEQILTEESAVDFIIRGEGEATAAALISALGAGLRGTDLQNIAGVSGRASGEIFSAPPRPPIQDLDAQRIAWELIPDWDAYRCFGLGRAAIIQFSRGCPHKCTYCGQHQFWTKWRHRDPVKVADEIQWLREKHDVRFITLADENPTTLVKPWRALLEELARRKLGVYFFATIRATDIVRDAEFLDLYRGAGILYVLMGIESTSDEILREVRKGSTSRRDFQACRLLKKAKIFSVVGHIVGLGDETPATFRTALKQLAHYDGDWLNAMYVTPHDWTAFGLETMGRKIVEPDQRNWDYRHQILAQTRMSPAKIFVHVKWLELRFHLRPARMMQIVHERDRFRQRQQLWTLFHCGMVWVAEIAEFIATRIRRLFNTHPREIERNVSEISAPMAARPSRELIVVK